MPWIFLRSCGSKILLNTPSVPVVTCHISLAAWPAAAGGDCPTDVVP